MVSSVVGRRGNMNDELKEILVTKIKVQSLAYSLDLIPTVWAGKSDMLMPFWVGTAFVGWLTTYSLARWPLHALCLQCPGCSQAKSFLFQSGSLFCVRKEIWRYGSHCAWYHFITPSWLSRAIALTSPRGWWFKSTRIALLCVSTTIFILWSGTVKLMALCWI